MHWDRSNLFERDDVYCAPVPTETTIIWFPLDYIYINVLSRFLASLAVIETLPIAGINSCRTGQTSMSSNRQHRVHDFLCAPKITTSASSFVGYRVLFTMNNINPEDCCRVCSFVFVSKKRKRNINGEFRKIFEEVFHQKLLTDDGLPHGKPVISPTSRFAYTDVDSPTWSELFHWS